MAGEHVEIATQRGHVVTAVHHALRAVDDGQRTLGLGQVQQVVQRLPATQHVGQLTHRQQSGTRPDQRGSCCQVDAPGGIDR